MPVPKRRFVIDARKIARKNRRVDAKQLAEATALLRELRKSGRVPAGYRLVSPFDHRFHPSEPMSRDGSGTRARIP